MSPEMQNHINRLRASWASEPSLETRMRNELKRFVDETQLLPGRLMNIGQDRFHNMHVSSDRTERPIPPISRISDQDLSSWKTRGLQRRWSIDVNTSNNDGRWEEPLAMPVTQNVDGTYPQISAQPSLQGPLYEKYVPRSTTNDDLKCLELANSSLSDPAFHAITQNGDPGWFHDETIDVGFEMLERVLECKKHRLALSNIYYATDLFKIGHWSLAQDEAGPDMQEAFPPQHLDASAKTKFDNKDFLIFPINDGFANGLIDPDDNRPWHSQLLRFRTEGRIKSGSGGHHWSVMIVDCRSPVLRGHYLDSTHRTVDHDSLNQHAAKYLLHGLQILLNEGNYRYTGVELYVDDNAPLQGRHNSNRRLDGNGACGPFVYLIAKEFSQYIVECHEDNAPIDLYLPAHFANRLQWDSARTRRAIQNLVNRELRTRRYLAGATWWMDENTGLKRPGWQSWLRAHQLPEDWFWDAYEGGTGMGVWFEKAE